MASELKTRILEDVKDAMRARDKVRLSTLRLVTAALKQREVDERVELDDAAVLAVLAKLVKQRQDSIEQYGAAGRTNLVAQEQAELAVIESYLPAALPAAELATMVHDAIAASAATSMQDMGKVMAILRPQVQGRADMGAVSQQVKQALSANG